MGRYLNLALALAIAGLVLVAVRNSNTANTTALVQHDRTTKLGMTGDISTMGDIHAAYIHGSVPTFKEESDDIMNLAFPDERSGSDSIEKMPAAYVRGTVITFNQEAQNIVNKSWAGYKEARAAKAAPVQLKLPRTTKLGMTGDISTMGDIHAAYIHGSVPTFKEESDDIMNLAFPDERSGSDSIEKMPAAYVRGTVITFNQEAQNIVNKSWAGYKEARAAKAAPVQLKLPRTTKLGMTGDISTMGDIHAAYIHGSVPTFKEESDDIMNLAFPDERSGSDSIEKMPAAYVRGTVITFNQEAQNIVNKSWAGYKEARAAKAAPVQLKLPRTTKLGMTGDISTMGDIHAAYIHGSVPTFKEESDDIMNLAFPDERSGSDSIEKMPAAYVRGTVITFNQEAQNIVNKTWAGYKEARAAKAPVVQLASAKRVAMKQQALNRKHGPAA